MLYSNGYRKFQVTNHIFTLKKRKIRFLTSFNNDNSKNCEIFLYSMLQQFNLDNFKIIPEI